jgi:hypothetical protein
LQVQGDAHTVDEDDALVEELLVRNLGVYELFEGGSRARELFYVSLLRVVAVTPPTASVS